MAALASGPVGGWAGNPCAEQGEEEDDSEMAWGKAAAESMCLEPGMSDEGESVGTYQQVCTGQNPVQLQDYGASGQKVTGNL